MVDRPNLISLTPVITGNAKPFEETFKVNGVKFHTFNLPNSNTSVTICPEFGGTVVSLVLNGVERLYSPLLLRKVENPSSKNIRVSNIGGMPFLLHGNRVYGGKLDNGRTIPTTSTWRRDNQQNPIHGTTYFNPWDVENPIIDGDVIKFKTSYIDDQSSIGLGVSRITINYALSNDNLRADVEILPQSDNDVICNPTFHPYFHIPGNGWKAYFQPSALMAEDRATGRVLAKSMVFQGTNHDAPKGIVLPGDYDSVFALPEKSSGHMHEARLTNGVNTTNLFFSSGLFRNVVLHSKKGEPFGCIEPIHGWNTGLNTPCGKSEVLCPLVINKQNVAAGKGTMTIFATC